MAGCDMSCDYLFSLRKWLGWLFAFLMASLPQHLIAQLGDAYSASAMPHAAVQVEPPAVATKATPPDEGTSGDSGATSGGSQPHARHFR